MKKFLAFSFFIFCFLSFIFSQDSAIFKNSYKTLLISFGQGRPLGSFSSSDANNQSIPKQAKGYAYGNCFANPGALFNIGLNLPIHKSKIGVTFNLGCNTNGLDGNNFAKFYTSEMNNNSTYTQVSATGNDFIIASFLTGVSYTKKTRKFAFDIKILTGPLFCHTPAILYSQSNPYTFSRYPGIITQTISTTTDSIRSFSSFSPAIELGLGVSYRFNSAAYLTVECNYLYSKTSISATTIMWYYGGPQFPYTSLVSSTVSSITIPISLLNLTIGLKFLL